MKIGVVGLGLIGGSVAKAYKKSGSEVYGFDTDKSVQSFAIMSDAVDGELNGASIPLCDIILISVYPVAAVGWLRQNAPYISKNTVVLDCCGIKRTVCESCFEIAEKYGFTFVGGHPMAGTHHSGFKHSDAAMFDGAPMVIVPPVYDDVDLYNKVKFLLAPLKFGSISVTTATGHDEIIAFTSQLAHIVSNAYIKSPTATSHKGFSAGSYKDMTRVAWLNADMWAELFCENGDMLLREIDIFIDNLSKYREAVAQGDKERLKALLNEGKRKKEEVDG